MTEVTVRTDKGDWYIFRDESLHSAEKEVSEAINSESAFFKLKNDRTGTILLIPKEDIRIVLINPNR